MPQTQKRTEHEKIHQNIFVYYTTTKVIQKFRVKQNVVVHSHPSEHVFSKNFSVKSNIANRSNFESG